MGDALRTLFSISIYMAIGVAVYSVIGGAVTWSNPMLYVWALIWPLGLLWYAAIWLLLAAAIILLSVCVFALFDRWIP